MKKTNLLFILLITLFSCSKEETPEVPSYIEGHYKLVGVDAPSFNSDINYNGKIEGFYTEFTTGDNVFLTNNRNKFLHLGLGKDYNNKPAAVFLFQVPGQVLDIKEIPDKYFDKNMSRRWYATAEKTLCPYDNNGAIKFNLNGDNSGSSYGGINQIIYHNNMLIISINSIYYNQKKKASELIKLKLIYKYLDNDIDKASKIAPSITLDKDDFTDK
ncbi:hypothetical protein K5X82_14855 [Halosquirtibacter xylanolyticus]|uniref:hypothetical protein n=1 Tax=Halosquirtibacter xylanolyticus TaxID=3374599 RepID=UPI003749935B|nr:hypothetical protein K5X82_14855 [Prolixibacteraceae bacterium]